MILPNKPSNRETPVDVPIPSIQGCYDESPYPALRDIKSELSAGVVRLEGNVPSYYLKQLAQEIALQHEGVKEVSNHICVDK